MNTLSIGDLKEISLEEMTEINGGNQTTPAEQTAYNTGYEIGTGIKKALAVIGIWTLFF